MLKRLPQFLSAKFRKMKPGQILAIGFGATILLGALLLMLPLAHQDGQTVGFVDALFTATSATCVTGLTVVNTGLTYSLFGKIVIMVLIQVGGLGFMTMASLLFMALGRRISLRERLLIQESFNADSLQGVVRLVRNAVLVTFTIEAAAAVILSIRLVPGCGLGEGIFSAGFLSVSGFCNAGFDTFGFANSIEVYVGDPVINIVLMLLVFLGGLGFAVILDILKNRRFGRLMLHSRIVLIMTFALLLSGALLTALLEWNNPKTLGDPSLNPAQKIMAAFFQSVTLRTAGFDTLGQGELTPAGHMVSVILMFIGAAPASTGGGIKVSTFFVLLLAVWTIAHGKTDFNVFHRRLNVQVVRRSVAIFCLALGLVLMDTVVICAAETFSGGTETVADILYEVVSAFGTVGLTTGITPQLHVVSRILIILTMFIGRLGPLTVSMALAGGPGNPDALRYPEDRLMVG